MAARNGVEVYEELLGSHGIRFERPDEKYREVVVDDYDRWSAPFDMWPYNIVRKLQGRSIPVPKLVVEPETPEQVEEAVRLARESGVCLIPVCGMSNVVGDTEPRGECVFLDLSRLDKVEEFRPEDRLVVVGAGARISSLIDWLEERGYTLTYRPQSEKLACIGGSISTLGAGAFSPGIGNIEDVVLWFEVVTPDGERLIVGSRANPRGVVLPGVNMVFFGGEGAYGVITRVALRVVEKPEARIGLSYTLPGFPEAIMAARRVYSWEPPQLMRVQDEREARLTYGLDEAVVLVEVMGPQRVAEAKADHIKELLESLGGREREGLVEEWWRNRYEYSRLMKMVLSTGLAFETIDMATYWSILPRLHEKIHEALDKTQGVALSYSHASHFYRNGGALYTTIVFDRDPDTYWRIWRTALETALGVGASILHHHGFGRVRAKWASTEYPGSTKLAGMIKKALDSEDRFKAGLQGMR